MLFPNQQHHHNYMEHQAHVSQMGSHPYEHPYPYFQYGNYQHRHYLGSQQPIPQYPMNHPYMNQYPKRQMSPLQSMFRNEKGNIDIMKIGNGVSNVVGLANQVGPVMKLFGGFLK